MTRLSVHSGDITKMQVDAIVNAANASLLGGGGVDGAIHRAAGPELLKACRILNGCKTGEAKITPGFLLPAKYVIHAVGPVWHGGTHSEAALLYGAYHSSLLYALTHDISTIAFPNISTGVYRFPKKQAAEIAIMAIHNFCNEHTGLLEKIFFACFDEENYQLYLELLSS